MVKTYQYQGLTWIDVESPTDGEVADLVKMYHLHPLVGDELLLPSSLPKVSIHDTYLYFVFRIPVRKRKEGGTVVEDKEIDFVVGKDYIITTKYDTVEPLHNFSKIFETNSIVDKSGIGAHAGYIFYYMMKQIYAHMMIDIENIRRSVLDAEAEIFDGGERAMVETLSVLSRELIDFRQAIRSHHELMDSLVETSDVSKKFFGSDFRHYLEAIREEYEKVNSSVTGARELIADLRSTNDSLLSAKQSEVMKRFTILAFITFPLSLFATITALPGDRATTVAIVIVIAAAVMLFIFRQKRWL